MTEKQRRICDAWDLHDDGDIGTERLMAMVEDDTGCDAGEISDALYARNQEEKKLDRDPE